MANRCDEYHQQQLRSYKHCQVCTANYSRAYRYPCKTIKEELWAGIGINQGADSPRITYTPFHPVPDLQRKNDT